VADDFVLAVFSGLPKNEPPKEGQEFPFVAAIALTLIARIKQNYCSRSCVRHHYWMETECEPSFHRR